MKIRDHHPNGIVQYTRTQMGILIGQLPCASLPHIANPELSGDHVANVARLEVARRRALES